MHSLYHQLAASKGLAGLAVVAINSASGATLKEVLLLNVAKFATLITGMGLNFASTDGH